MNHKKISEKECIDAGGHCWNYHDSNEHVDEFGNKLGIVDCGSYAYVKYWVVESVELRTCKHCGKKEKKIPDNWEKV